MRLGYPYQWLNIKYSVAPLPLPPVDNIEVRAIHNITTSTPCTEYHKALTALTPELQHELENKWKPFNPPPLPLHPPFFLTEVPLSVLVQILVQVRLLISEPLHDWTYEWAVATSDSILDELRHVDNSEISAHNLHHGWFPRIKPRQPEWHLQVEKLARYISTRPCGKLVGGLSVG